MSSPSDGRQQKVTNSSDERVSYEYGTKKKIQNKNNSKKHKNKENRDTQRNKEKHNNKYQR